MPITQKYTLICDDVRQEVTGKLIIVGLYMGTITVPQIPAQLPGLTIFQVFDSDRIGALQFRMRIQNLDNGQTVAEAMGMMNIPRPGIGVAPIRFAPVQFTAVGSYNVVTTIENESPIIVQFDVVLQQQPQQQFMQPGGFGR